MDRKEIINVIRAKWNDYYYTAQQLKGKDRDKLMNKADAMEYLLLDIGEKL